MLKLSLKKAWEDGEAWQLSNQICAGKYQSEKDRIKRKGICQVSLQWFCGWLFRAG